jgi:hypothetical protein
VKRHILELGVVPLAWRLKQEAAEKIKKAAPTSRRRRRSEALKKSRAVGLRGTPGGFQMVVNEPESSRDAAVLVESVATSVLAQVDGDDDSMAAVAAAGAVPLRAWLLATGPLGPGQEGRGDEGSDGGPGRFRKPDDGRGGGSLAYLK